MFAKVAQFIKDVQLEMGKVTWPTRDELIASTTIVLVVSLALSLFIFAVDFVLSLVRRFGMS
ncbi:MAG: preprotein translocase subunit SecE [Gemmatimonadetes bacterium]|nr:preprotein translocase subunit SecE [Gemmatimonadota bacterium]MDE3257072.1 preprotein translocase subunit SecE [Gemmatimonadota bacterium]